MSRQPWSHTPVPVVLDLIAKGHLREPQIWTFHAPSACEQRHSLTAFADSPVSAVQNMS